MSNEVFAIIRTRKEGGEKDVFGGTQFGRERRTNLVKDGFPSTHDEFEFDVKRRIGCLSGFSHPLLLPVVWWYHTIPYHTTTTIP